MSEKIKALFFDRDGTLILDKHYLHDPDEVEIIPGTGEALKAAVALGYQLFLFTNQSGIGRGYYTLEDVHACNARTIQLLGFKESPFVETCIAPETPDDEQVYRKPSPKFIQEMTVKHAIDLDKSFMVGDKIADWEAGVRGKTNPIAVATGKPLDGKSGEYIASHQVPVFEDVARFVEHLKTL